MNTARRDAIRICFVGGGNMALAIVRGLGQAGSLVPAPVITAVDPVEAARTKLTAAGVRALATWPEGDSFDVVVLAVKPQLMVEAISPLAHLPDALASSLVISVMAGVRTATLSRHLAGHSRIVRAMPNTPAMISAGVTALFASSEVDAEAKERAEALLSTVGKVVWVPTESDLDTVTAVSGSGPAYVFYFIEALEAVALDAGLDATTARTLAVETFRGAALLAAESADAPAQLRQNVTSKRGTTEAALAQFAEEELAERFQRGVSAARNRARTLGDEIDQQ